MILYKTTTHFSTGILGTASDREHTRWHSMRENFAIQYNASIRSGSTRRLAKTALAKLARGGHMAPLTLQRLLAQSQNPTT